MNILNAQEAFAALQKGKTVLCRYAGDGTLRADKDFSSLDQMPATVFASSNYEFCIQLEMLELAGITFTKPLMLEEIEDGQDVYVTNTYGQTIYISEFGKMTCDALIDSINSGFVQRDEENAKLQLQALSKALGRELIGECQVIRLGNEKPKKRTSSKKAGNEVNTIPTTEPEQIPHVEALEEITSNDVEEKTLTENAEPQPEIDPPVESTTDSIEVQASQAEEKDVEAVVKQAQDEHYQKLLGELLERASIAKTPNEANALYKYTMKWTEEQRKPLMDAIHARLVELNPPVEDSSLSVRISKAMDLTELDALEIDVSTCDEFIQPQLMTLVNKRRAELDPFFNPLGNSKPLDPVVEVDTAKDEKEWKAFCDMPVNRPPIEVDPLNACRAKITTVVTRKSELKIEADQLSKLMTNLFGLSNVEWFVEAGRLVGVYMSEEQTV